MGRWSLILDIGHQSYRMQPMLRRVQTLLQSVLMLRLLHYQLRQWLSWLRW
jgi:hypothetical protein